MDKTHLLPKAIVAEFGNIGKSLAAIIETKDASEILGEPWLTHLRTVHDQINTTLASMPPTDQIAAAGEANWALTMLHHNLMSVQNIVRTVTGVMENSRSKFGSLKASADKLVELQADIDTGALVRKDAVEGLVNQAKKDAEAAGFKLGLSRGNRLAGLALCGLPETVVKATPDNILALEDAEFETKKTAAKDRVTKLDALGVTHATAPETVNDLAWAEDARFTSQYEVFTKIKGGGSTHAEAPKTPTTPVNPMLGGAGGGAAAAAVEEKQTLRILA
jgi:hypothetical protein